MEQTTTLETHAALRARMEGELLEHGDTGYEDARASDFVAVRDACLDQRLRFRCCAATRPSAAAPAGGRRRRP